MTDAADLLRAIAWPIVVLVIFLYLRDVLAALLRGTLTDLLVKLGDRILTAQTIKLGPKGVELVGQVASLKQQVKQLSETVDIKTQPAIGPRDRATATLVAPTAIPATLLALADQYDAANGLRGYAARVRRKNKIADEAAADARRTGTPRTMLAQSDRQGLIAAVATMIVADPLPDDAAVWLRAAPNAGALHVAYRLALAMAELKKHELVAPDQVAPVDACLAVFRAHAVDRTDTALLAMLDSLANG